MPSLWLVGQFSNRRSDIRIPLDMDKAQFIFGKWISWQTFSGTVNAFSLSVEAGVLAIYRDRIVVQKIILWRCEYADRLVRIACKDVHDDERPSRSHLLLWGFGHAGCSGETVALHV